MSEKKYVITISRQFGSLGRPIAKKLAERLGIAYYDRELVDRTAKQMNMTVSEIVELEESVKGGFFQMKYPLGLGTSSVRDRIFENQKRIIKELAEKESCVIVGRCADSILYEYEKARERYHMEYAGFLPGDPKYKDLLIDSSVLGVEKTVDLLENYVRLFMSVEPCKKPQKCIQF